MGRRTETVERGGKEEGMKRPCWRHRTGTAAWDHMRGSLLLAAVAAQDPAADDVGVHLVVEGREDDRSLAHPEAEDPVALHELGEAPQDERHPRLPDRYYVVVDVVKVLGVVQNGCRRAAVGQPPLQEAQPSRAGRQDGAPS